MPKKAPPFTCNNVVCAKDVNQQIIIKWKETKRKIIIGKNVRNMLRFMWMKDIFNIGSGLYELNNSTDSVI